MKRRKVSRTAKRIFRKLLDSDGPAHLDLHGVSEDAALEAIHEVGDMVRVSDAANPLDAMYVFTAGSRGAFVPWDRKVKAWLRSMFPGLFK